jgi:hypothetical protein
MVEVLIQTEADKTKSVHLRPTSTRFDEVGKLDLHYAVEAMAVILGGSEPKRISKDVLDIGPTLRTRAREREANWRIPQSIKRSILADVKGGAKLPIFRVSGMTALMFMNDHKFFRIDATTSAACRNLSGDK